MSVATGLDPRRDLGLIRERLALQLNAREDITDTLRDLAERDAIALADLVVGPRAQANATLIRAALTVVEVMETAIAPNGLYRRLMDLSEHAAPDVLEVASRRHPAASWMIQLSRQVEGQAAGQTHLCAAAGHPAFTAACWAHAEAGHRDGLVTTATTTGLPEPAAALAALGDLDGAAKAAVRALEHTPTSPVVATIAAAWGPDVRPVLRRSVSYLRTRAAAEALRAQASRYPDIAAMLERVARGMVQTP
jgi:hypothetical protein